MSITRSIRITLSWRLLAGFLVLFSAQLPAQPVDVEFHVKDEWGSGFVGEIAMTNRGSTPIQGWTLELDLGGGLVSLWNGGYSRNATHYSVSDLGWNGAIAPSGSVSFGLQISYSGDRPEPTNCIFNGAACSFGAEGGDSGPTPPQPTPPVSDFQVEWIVVNQWSNGYTAKIRILNDSSAELADWDLGFELGGRITNYWGASISSSGSARSAQGAAWNRSIPAGGFVELGFNGRYQGDPPEPSSCVLNGVVCRFAGASEPSQPPEPQPLEISITAPMKGATVANTVSIVAEVSGGEGVERVEFLVDGAPTGSDTSFPYSYAWPSATVSDGAHTLTARAISGSGEATSEPVTVTVMQPTPPPSGGRPGFLSMSGSTMVDSDGGPVRLTGVNWFGFETGSKVVHGLWSRDYRSMLHQVRDLGFNALRIPWSNAILEPGAVPNGIAFSGADPYDGRSPMNQPLQGKTSMEILDLLIEEAARQGLKVILDNHSRKPDNFLAEGLWYLPDFPESRWIADWTTMAERYRDNTAVVAFDLHNEPHNEASWGGNPTTDWAAAAERAAAAIHAVHPDAILIVGGVQTHDGVSHWWGGNLRGVRDRPLDIRADKLLYSAHDYGPEVFAQPWFSAPDYPNNLPGLWDETWGYIPRENLGGVFIGEFGIKDRNSFGGRALEWIQALMAYMGGSSSWTFWALNPNSGDTGGILQDDWATPQQWKLDLLTPYQAEQFPTQE